MSRPNRRIGLSRRRGRHQQQQTTQHLRQKQLGAWAEEMASAFGELEADESSFEKSGFAAGGSADRSDVFELSIVDKSTARVLVERDQAQTG